jgi:hypothetical protein
VDRKPILMVTDPPYGIELDMEWRDRAGLNSPGHKRTAFSKAAAKRNLTAPAQPSYMKHRTERGLVLPGVRAADCALDHAQQAIEIEDVEVRVHE